MSITSPSSLKRTGKKWRGFRGGNFLPASRSEAPPPRALSGEAEAEKFSFPFRRKNLARANQKS